MPTPSLSGRALRGACTIGPLLAACGAAQAQPFAVGDIYLITTGTSNPGVACSAPAVVRITPASGAWSSSAITRPTVLNGRGCYDPFRQRIVACRTSSVAPTLIDSAGAEYPLTEIVSNRFALATTGAAGKLYVWGAAQVSYYDPSNTLQSLMNQAGSGPYVFSGPVGAMHYHAGTNSLFFASAAAGDLTEISRVPLNASGTQVVGPATTVTFDATGGVTGESPVGFSKGPSGSLFLKIADTTNLPAGRMRLIDPSTLSVSVFATSDYFGTANETAGAYVPTRGQAVMLDTFNDQLRTYSPGDSGPGGGVVISGTFVSGCGSGEVAQIVVIEAPPAPPACYANCDGNTSPPLLSAADFTCFITRFRAGDPYANCDGNTSAPLLSAADFTCFLNSFRAGCP